MNELLNLVSVSAEKAVELAKLPVCGQPISLEGKTVIPVSAVSAGFAGGGIDSNGEKKSGTTGGSGTKVSVTPMAVLVCDGNEIRLIPADRPPHPHDGPHGNPHGGPQHCPPPAPHWLHTAHSAVQWLLSRRKK